MKRLTSALYKVTLQMEEYPHILYHFQGLYSTGKAYLTVLLNLKMLAATSLCISLFLKYQLFLRISRFHFGLLSSNIFYI